MQMSKAKYKRWLDIKGDFIYEVMGLPVARVNGVVCSINLRPLLLNWFKKFEIEDIVKVHLIWIDYSRPKSQQGCGIPLVGSNTKMKKIVVRKNEEHEEHKNKFLILFPLIKIINKTKFLPITRKIL